MNMLPLVSAALKEDINNEDITTEAILTGDEWGEVELIAKENGIVCGLPVFEMTFKLLDERVEIDYKLKEGSSVESGNLVAVIKGPLAAILSGERVALNYLQRMSGIATKTHEAAAMLSGTGITLVDTRKTLPNNRIFDKYAVRVGGGKNHRYNLSDGILIKDNHIDAAGGIKGAVEAVRRKAPFVDKIEVETETLEQVSEALDCHAEIIMLDNMDIDTMKKAIKLIDGRALIEISGNITKEKIDSLKGLKVDFISSGALTHSVKALDFSMKHMRRTK
jgi:nicotinate-nucleotide pyrophosphorylase (carboxylating)